MRVWIFQDHKQKKRLGEKKCPWSVGWLQDGKRRSKSIGPKTTARHYAAKLQGEIVTGTIRDECTLSWDEFRKEYEATLHAKKDYRSARADTEALDHFQRIVRPKKIAAVALRDLDKYIAQRVTEKGKKRGSTVSIATLNKELRHLRAALNFAASRDYLKQPIKVRMLREVEKEASFVTEADFAAIYAACDAAKYPSDQPYAPADYWRALLTFLYLTGWRIGEALSLPWSDVDWEGHTAITRVNKGKREERISLHPVVFEHLETIRSFSPLVFPWASARRRLYAEFHRVQRSAGIHRECRGDHECNPSCHFYGFHDLRRSFASENALALPPVVLQKLMRHRSFTTTQKYINLAERANEAVVAQLKVPACLTKQA